MRTDKMVFVFGSNEGGLHGGGAARFAREERGAVMGKSYGHYGQSFAIPTKNASIDATLDRKIIGAYVLGFIAYARSCPKQSFQVTQIGCGLAGMKPQDVAELFYEAISYFNVKAFDNIYFDKAWAPYLDEGTKYWGTMP